MFALAVDVSRQSGMVERDDLARQQAELLAGAGIFVVKGRVDALTRRFRESASPHENEV